jgi:hypothetical protein
MRLSTFARVANRRMVNATPSVDDESVWIGANPPVFDGDYVEYETATTPDGFPVTLGPDGIAVIQAGGSTARERYIANHFSRYTLDFTGDRLQTVNNSTPTAPTQNLTMTVGIVFGPLNFVSVVTNAENDPLTFQINAGDPPDGTTFNAGVLQGTPITAGNGFFDVQVDDGLDSSIFRVNWTVNPSSTGTTAGPLVDGTRVKTHVGGALVQ